MAAFIFIVVVQNVQQYTPSKRTIRWRPPKGRSNRKTRASVEELFGWPWTEEALFLLGIFLTSTNLPLTGLVCRHFELFRFFDIRTD